MLAEQELMAIHAQTLFIHEANSRLLFVNEPGGGGPSPRLFLGRTRMGNLWRFRADLPANLIEELEALCADEPSPAEFSAAPRHIDEQEVSPGRCAYAYFQTYAPDAPAGFPRT